MASAMERVTGGLGLARLARGVDAGSRQQRTLRTHRQDFAQMMKCRASTRPSLRPEQVRGMIYLLPWSSQHFLSYCEPASMRPSLHPEQVRSTLSPPSMSVARSISSIPCSSQHLCPIATLHLPRASPRPPVAVYRQSRSTPLLHGWPRARQADWLSGKQGSKMSQIRSDRWLLSIP